MFVFRGLAAQKAALYNRVTSVGLIRHFLLVHIDEILTDLEIAIRERQSFIAITLPWRRVLPYATEREIARAQQRLVARHRQRVQKAGLDKPFILSVFESTSRMGYHGHLMAGVPDNPEKWLLAIERQLAREFGDLPPGFPWRDGRHGGRVLTAAAARGACAYRLKSIVADGERGIRRGLGLRPVSVPPVRLSRGRR